MVDGPVGSSWLKDPATSGPIGANVEALAPIEIEPNRQDDKAGSMDHDPGDSGPGTRGAMGPAPI